MAIRTLFPDFLVGNAIPQADDLPARETGRSGSRAGRPGVFVLTDSDLTSYYYVEACQTLRIAIANLLRGSSRRGVESIKPRLAEHLGIPEPRVAKYLASTALCVGCNSMKGRQISRILSLPFSGPPLTNRKASTEVCRNLPRSGEFQPIRTISNPFLGLDELPLDAPNCRLTPNFDRSLQPAGVHPGNRQTTGVQRLIGRI